MFSKAQELLSERFVVTGWNLGNEKNLVLLIAKQVLEPPCEGGDQAIAEVTVEVTTC